MPHYKTQQKEKARHLYMFTSGTFAEIAFTVGVHVNTITRWAQNGNWREQKKEAIYSARQAATQLYEELRSINSNINSRDEELRYCNKTELEAKAKIITMLCELGRKQPDPWREPTPELELKHPPADAPEPPPCNYDVNDPPYYCFGHTDGKVYACPKDEPRKFMDTAYRKELEEQELFSMLHHVLLK